MDQTAAVNVGPVVQFLDEFAALRAQRHVLPCCQIAEFLTAYAARHRELEQLRPVEFSIFAILGVSFDEVRQSAFLAWLLDARSGHKQGSLFLQSFLSICEITIDPGSLEQYEVTTEHSGPESRVDIAVWSRGCFLLYIENKVLAPEGRYQLARELRDLRRLGASLHIPADHQYAVFLTPTGRPPESGDPSAYVPVSYPDVARAFRSVLDQISSPKVRLVVEDWIATAVSIGGGL